MERFEDKSESSYGDDTSSEGDVCGIIEADGLALKELPVPPLQEHGHSSLGRGRGAWRLSALAVRPPRLPVVEDEDGDLAVPRGGKAAAASLSEVTAGLIGASVEFRHLATSRLARVGLQLWAGALVLSDLLLARPELVAGRHVCELGAGLGLCSVLAAKLGAASVLCTDGNAEVVRNCEAILKRNDVGNSARAAVVAWEDPPGSPLAADESLTEKALTDMDVGKQLWGAEVLLAADVIYDAPAAEALAALAGLLLQRGRAEVLHLAVEKRVYFSAATLKPEIAAYPQFLDHCGRHGLIVEPADLSEVPVFFDYTRSRCYELVAVTAVPDRMAKRPRLQEDTGLVARD